MLPEDTYAISEHDIKLTSTQKVATPSAEDLKEQYPHLSDSDIQALSRTDTKATASGKGGKLTLRDKSPQFLPWQEVRDSLLDFIKDMDPQEKAVLLEMNKAHESTAFLSNTMTRLKQLPTNPTEVFNVADGFVRRIIKVAKQLEYFRAIEKDDQIALLKGSVVEIMMIRSAVNYDVKTETWNLSTVSCIKHTNPSSDASSPGSSDSQSKESDPSTSPAGLNIEELRKAAMNGADLGDLRKMARMGAGKPESAEQMTGTSINSMKEKFSSNEDRDSAGLDSLRAAAKAAGFDVDALRKAAMNGASFDQLSQMAHSTAGKPQEESPSSEEALVKQEQESSNSSGSSNSISSEILKLGNPETKTMFLTYSKFIRSLMSTISGDLIVLKFLIMLSLFSPDRQGLKDRALVDKYQEVYANTLRKYIEVRFPDTKNMFARCIMKLTDLRNINEVHTKMLLKMQVKDIEPLLVEIFDLQQ